MQTRTALTMFGITPGTGPMSDPAFKARMAARAAEHDEGVNRQRVATQFSDPHLALASRLSREAAGSETVLDAGKPVSDNFTAYKAASAVYDAHPGDRGVQTVFASLKTRYERNRTGSITVGDLAQLRRVAELQGGSRSHAGACCDEIVRRGYANIDVRHVAALVDDITDQASFNAVTKRAGIATNQPGHVQARALLAALVNARDAGEGGDPFEVVVVEQQPAAMSGPKRDGGGAALAADDMGKATASLLAGREVRVGKSILRPTAEATIQLIQAGKVVATSGLAGIERLLRRADIYEPKVNEQQPPAVDISPEEAAGVLGDDSQVKDLGPDPKVQSQPDPMKQPGTSTSIKGKLVCTGCRKVQATRFNHTPRWVSQPLIWRGLTARYADKTGIPYGRIVSAYKAECEKLQVKATKDVAPEAYRCASCNKPTMFLVVADAGATLGPDESTTEPSWTPVTDAHPNAPGKQPGTALPNKGDAVEPDHQQDNPGWVDPGPIETSKLGPKAKRIDASLPVESPGLKYVEALRNRPGEGATRAAVRAATGGATGAGRWQRFAFKQINLRDGTPVASNTDGSYTYNFSYAASAGSPQVDDLQGYVDACKMGDYRVLRAAVEGNRVVAVIGDAGVFRNLTVAEKRARIASAMGGGDKGNNGGEGMASDFNDGLTNLAKCAKCGEEDTAFDPVTAAAKCAKCGEMVPPVEAPDMAPPANATKVGQALVTATNSGKFAVRSAAAPYAIAGYYPTRKAANGRASAGVTGVPVVATLKGGVGVKIGERVVATFRTFEAAATYAKMRALADYKAFGDMVDGIRNASRGAVTIAASVAAEFFDRRTDLTVVNPRQAARLFLENNGMAKEAASIHEGWGDAGTFERTVDADSAEELWKLHKGLNGVEPAWPQAPQAPPVSPDAAIQPPGDPKVDGKGDIRPPEPPPATLSGGKR